MVIRELDLVFFYEFFKVISYMVQTLIQQGLQPSEHPGNHPFAGRFSDFYQNLFGKKPPQPSIGYSGQTESQRYGRAAALRLSIRNQRRALRPKADLWSALGFGAAGALSRCPHASVHCVHPSGGFGTLA